jgi:hypothetical protein
MEVAMFHQDGMGERHRKWKEMSAGKKALVIVGWLIVLVGFVALAGLIVMLLWNRIMSRVIGLPALGFWEALGLLVLARILLGGGKGMSMMGRMRRRRIMREHMARREAGEAGEENLD